MAVSQIIDVTADFNAAGLKNIDLGGWDWVVVQLETPASAVSFKHTNDAGAVTGSTDGNALSANNFIAVQGVDLSTGTAATSSATSSLYRFGVIGKYLQLSGTTAAKILVHLSKIG